MTREAIEKAIKEAEAELALTQGDVWCSGPVTREVWRANVLRSLVDAVLEEAAKACAGAAVKAVQPWIIQMHMRDRCVEAVLALKSQEPAKP